MLKLLATIGVFLVVGLVLLGLRQHRLELTSQTAKLHDEIVDREQVLWGQQEQIARKTNPVAVSEGLKKAMPELTAAYLTGSTPAERGALNTARGTGTSTMVPPRPGRGQ